MLYPNLPNEGRVLQYAVEFGPLAVVYGAFVVVNLILARRRMPSRIRFQRWVSALGASSPLLWSPWFLAVGFSNAFGAFLVPHFTGKPAPLSAAFWIFWGIFMTVAYPVASTLFKKPHAPQDWLLWDKEEAKNR